MWEFECENLSVRIYWAKWQQDLLEYSSSLYYIRKPTFTFWHLVQGCIILYNLVQGQKGQKLTK